MVRAAVPHPLLHFAAQCLVSGCVLALALAAAAPASGQIRQFGEDLTVEGCLTISVTGYSDRQSDLRHDDWVTTVVRNGCPHPVKHLLVELRLVDRQGNTYGRRIWLLKRGELLLPRRKRTARHPVPDPGNQVAIGWKMTVLRAERHRRRAPAKR